MKKLCEDMAMSMYREGRLDREIAEAIGYSRVSVTNWRKSRGLPPNRRRRPEKMLDAYKAAMPLERVQELSQAEKDGRLVVLPCKPGDELTRNGLTFKADHWNVLLTAFADDASAPLGKRVKLFYPEEAEAALKKRED